MNQVAQILQLIQPFVDEDKILPRTYAQISQCINDFVLIYQDGRLIACAGIKDCQENQIGEIYALAVSTKVQNHGVSARLLQKIIQKSIQLNLCHIFALTKYGGQWFIKNGFVEAGIHQLPKKRQAIFDHQRNPCIFIKNIKGIDSL